MLTKKISVAHKMRYDMTRFFSPPNRFLKDFRKENSNFCSQREIEICSPRDFMTYDDND